MAPPRKLTDKQALEAYRLAAIEGWTYRRIAEKFRIHHNFVYRICHGLSYRHLCLESIKRPQGNGQIRYNPHVIVCSICGKERIQPAYKVRRQKSDLCKTCSIRKTSRKNRGECSYRAVLSETQVLYVYRQCSMGRAYGSVAKELGVSENAVRSICQGRTWRHLGLTPLPRRQ